MTPCEPTRWEPEDEPRYRYLLEPAARRLVATTRWRNLLATPGVERLWLGGIDDVPAAYALPMPWDSQMLDERVGSSIFPTGPNARYRDDLKEVVSEAMDRWPCDYLFARIDAGDARASSALQKSGLAVIESLITFGGSVRVEGSVAEPLCAEDEAEVASIAESAFIDGRYLVDDSIPAQVGKGVYRAWAVNAVHGRVGDAVIGIRRGREILGFATLSIDQVVLSATGHRFASIGLIAVHPESQGKGVGRALVQGALEWGRQRGCTQFTVGTQTSNLAAQRLYTGMGLRPIGCEVSLRRVRSS